MWQRRIARIVVAGIAASTISPIGDAALRASAIPAPEGPARGWDAAKGKITGRLNARGYTVFALAANGRARLAPRSGRRFRVRPPAEVVTLHLRAKDGTYAGPIVVRRMRARSIFGVVAGASLGRIRVKKGFAVVARRPSAGAIDPSRWGRARRGTPIGARKFGLGGVKKKRVARLVLGDRDIDGIPNVLDIDDDGDRLLDNIDRRGKATGGPAFASAAPNEFGLHARHAAPIYETANANAGVSDAEIDGALPASLRLDVEILPGDRAELDCGGLSYCSPGGTGRVFCAACTSEADWPPFPECCDADDDGHGVMPQEPSSADPFFFLSPRATSGAIGSGDVLVERVTTGGQENQFASALQFVFATVPALVGLTDGAGGSHTISYPVAGPDPGPPGPGAPGAGLVVSPGPAGDVILTLTLWRPQRRALPTEGDGWVDIGGLTYQFGAFTDVPGLGSVAKMCPASSLSEDDPDLGPPVPEPGGGRRDDRWCARPTG